MYAILATFVLHAFATHPPQPTRYRAHVFHIPCTQHRQQHWLILIFVVFAEISVIHCLFSYTSTVCPVVAMNSPWISSTTIGSKWSFFLIALATMYVDCRPRRDEYLRLVYRPSNIMIWKRKVSLQQYNRKNRVTMPAPPSSSPPPLLPPPPTKMNFALILARL